MLNFLADYKIRVPLTFRWQFSKIVFSSYYQMYATDSKKGKGYPMAILSCKFSFIMTHVIHTPATNDNDFKNIVTFLNIYGGSRV
jgi:hypothetical protein